MFTRWEYLIRLISIGAVFAVLTGEFLDQRVAYAQGDGNDYVDVGLTLEIPDTVQPAPGSHGQTITVVNHGSTTAYDVEVVVNIVYPANSSYFLQPSLSGVPVGNVSLENDSYSLRWSIPALGELQGESLLVKVRHRSRVDEPFDNRLFVHKYSGEVTTSSFESGHRKENNKARVWAYNYEPFSTKYIQAGGNYSVAVSVDEPSPAPGETVNFTITADRASPYSPTYAVPPPIDLTVDIELTDGLTVTGMPSYDPPDEPDSVRYSNGVFNIGTLKSDRLRVPTYSVTLTLPVTVASSADVNKQCLTATLTGNPPPGVGELDDEVPDNVAKVCLGAAPAGEQVVLDSGDVDLFTWYDCVGKTAAPCHESDSLELIAQEATTASQAGGVFQPSQVVVHIPDPSGRTLSSTTGSTALVWSTGFAQFNGIPGNQARPGVVLSINTSVDTTVWGEPHPQAPAFQVGNSKVDVSGPGEASVWGNFNTGSPFVIFNAATNGNMFDGASSLGSDFAVYAEFSKLGTYEFAYRIRAKHNGGNGDCDADDDSTNDGFCDTETYTFHVGPMQDLKVLAGAAGDVPAGRTAYTIRAVNNGPENSADATVKIELPPGALVEDHVASEGTAYDNGVWDLRGLKLGDYRRSQGIPEEVTLTLILKDEGGAPEEPATATISLTDNSYNVCIASDRSTLAHDNETECVADTANGGSWHEGTIYDPPANNTAKITAVKGTGGVGPGAPGNPRTQTGTTTVMWDEVEYLYGLPVVGYKVQGLGSEWAPLGDVVIGNEYWDAAPTGRRAYRVRAVNEAGVAGPWSRSSVQVRNPQQQEAGLAGPPRNLKAQADGNNAIDLFWDAPADPGGSDITGYTVQWSADGAEDSWRNAGSTSSSVRNFKHRGLSVGAVRWYRVAARNSSGLGLWSNQVMGQTEAGAPDAPTLRARALSDYEIDLTWNKPRDNGKPVTGYRIEFSDDGSSESWSRLVDLGADATGYTDNALQSNARRYYRIRAVNSAGEGAWSRVVSATTQIAPPNPPSLSGVTADGPNAIVVTWEEPYVFDGSRISQYEVQWAKNPSAETWRSGRKFSGSTRSWRHTGLQPNETWHYRVRASNGGGRWSVWSYTASATTASESAPSREPGGLTAQYDTASGHVTLKWRQLSGSAEITGYELQYSQDNSQWRDLTTTGAGVDDLTYTDTGHHLHAGAQVYYRVRAVTDDGVGPWSRSVRVQVPADPPDEPRLMSVEADGSNHIRIYWEPPYYDRGADITGYRLLWCRVPERAQEDPCDVAPEDQSDPLADPPGYRAISLGASARSYTHSVSPGYYYYYLLRATNGGNRWSEWDDHHINYARTYAGAPSAPGLTARAVDSSRIKLTWSKPNAYGAEINYYVLYVYRDGEKLYDFDNVLDAVSVPGDQTEYTVEDLSPGTPLYFRIRAVSDNGEGKFSALRQATTPSN